MLTDDQIRQDLAKLKDIVIAHKAADAPLATHSELINGVQFDVFTRIPANLDGIYRLGLQVPEQTFLVCAQERISFAETYTMACRMGRVLLEQYRIKKGDRVAICSRNYPEWCLAYMATTIIGAIVVPMNSWWTATELKFGLEDSASRLLFADPERLRRVQDLVPELDLELIAIKPTGDSDYPEFYRLLQQVKPLSAAEIAELAVLPEDNVSIMYTSGSTGLPKGVLSTHRNITNALYTWQFVKEINEILRPELVEENPESVPAILANVPLFHVTGSHAQFLSSFLHLRKFVMMYKWDADTALALIEKERISVLHGVPTMAWEVMQSEKFSSTDLRSLRSVQSGGAPRPPEHLTLIQQKFAANVIPGLGYGLTETNAIGAIISGKFYQARPHSTGRPTPPVTAVKIVDENDTELNHNEVGEICIKGPTVMKGYWNNPLATAQVIKDNWFYTGDIGKLDELGFLIILDRAKDIVIRGGENIGCAEVEYAITEHPQVREVSVYGAPDDRLGEILCATVMLHAECEMTVTELQSFLNDKIAHFKIPQLIYFQHNQLPRIASGKIAKKELRQLTIELLANQ